MPAGLARSGRARWQQTLPEPLTCALGDSRVCLLAPVLPEEYESGTDPGVYFDLRNYREPDVVIYRRSALQVGRLTPGDVLLAVEVMSPGSVASDRVAKPAQYAAAGIAHFWRIEQDPLVLVTYELADGTYRETGRWTDQVVLERPVRLSFALSPLVRT